MKDKCNKQRQEKIKGKYGSKEGRKNYGINRTKMRD
jgi:hypothetical protein